MLEDDASALDEAGLEEYQGCRNAKTLYYLKGGGGHTVSYAARQAIVRLMGHPRPMRHATADVLRRSWERNRVALDDPSTFIYWLARYLNARNMASQEDVLRSLIAHDKWLALSVLTVSDVGMHRHHTLLRELFHTRFTPEDLARALLGEMRRPPRYIVGVGGLIWSSECAAVQQYIEETRDLALAPLIEERLDDTKYAYPIVTYSRLVDDIAVLKHHARRGSRSRDFVVSLTREVLRRGGLSEVEFAIEAYRIAGEGEENRSILVREIVERCDAGAVRHLIRLLIQVEPKHAGVISERLAQLTGEEIHRRSARHTTRRYLWLKWWVTEGKSKYAPDLRPASRRDRQHP